MPTESIPVSAITSVRLTCRKCEAAYLIPPHATEAPNQCFACGERLPGHEIARGLVKELRWIAGAVREAGVSFDVAVESLRRW